MKKYIKNYCETCNVRLNKRNYFKHFNANHKLRTVGQFVINSKDVNIQNIKTRNLISGIAITNAKAGDNVLIELN